MRFKVILAALLAVPFLTACETEEDRVLADTQSCLNHATPANVDACVAKLNGMTNEQSYLLRCTAHFIAQDITAGTLATAFQNIKNSTTGGVPSMTFAMSYVTFNESIAGHTTALALSDCTSGGAGYLKNIVKLSELANTFALGNPAVIQDPAALAAAINAYPGPPADIGNIAIDLKESFCDNGNFKNTDICNKVNQAYNAAGGDPATIGSFIQGLLD